MKKILGKCVELKKYEGFRKEGDISYSFSDSFEVFFHYFSFKLSNNKNQKFTEKTILKSKIISLDCHCTSDIKSKSVFFTPH